MRCTNGVGRHPAETAGIDVRAGSASFTCGECHDDLVVVVESPQALVDAWESFVRDHHGCLRRD
jgi:hypothetical protein